jgi:KUP system potassium uptake protein
MLLLVTFVDLAFFCANITRVVDNGWVPIAIAAAIFVVITTWSEGRRLLKWTVGRQKMTLDDFKLILREQPLERIEGTAVYLPNEAGTILLTLVQQLGFHRFPNERAIILTFASAEVPWISSDELIRCENLADGVVRITARYGVQYDPNTTTYIVGRTTPKVTSGTGLLKWKGCACMH